MKKCTKCKEEKPLSGFNKNKSRKDGYQSSCKKCHSKMMLEYKENGFKKKSDSRSVINQDYVIKTEKR